MKIVSREQYLKFLSAQGMAVQEVAHDREVTGLVQTVDSNSEVKAQVVYFKHADTPQYMIDVREPWGDVRRARSLEDAAVVST